MSGRKGARHGKRRDNNLRRQMWKAMRIMKRFTIPELVMTTGATYISAQRFVYGLRRHGLAAASPNYRHGPGNFQQYRILGITGSEYPNLCPKCYRSFKEVCETETETETETERETETDSSASRRKRGVA